MRGYRIPYTILYIESERWFLSRSSWASGVVNHTCFVLFRTRKVLSRFSLVVWFGVRIGRMGDAARAKSRVTPRRSVFGWKRESPMAAQAEIKRQLNCYQNNESEAPFVCHRQCFRRAWARHKRALWVVGLSPFLWRRQGKGGKREVFVFRCVSMQSSRGELGRSLARLQRPPRSGDSGHAIKDVVIKIV